MLIWEKRWPLAFGSFGSFEGLIILFTCVHHHHQQLWRIHVLVVEQIFQHPTIHLVRLRVLYRLARFDTDQSKRKLQWYFHINTDNTNIIKNVENKWIFWVCWGRGSKTEDRLRSNLSKLSIKILIIFLSLILYFSSWK